MGTSHQNPTPKLSFHAVPWDIFYCPHLGDGAVVLVMGKGVGSCHQNLYTRGFNLIYGISLEWNQS